MSTYQSRTSPETRRLASRIGNLSRVKDPDQAAVDAARIEHAASRAHDELNALIAIKSRVTISLSPDTARGLQAHVEAATTP